MQPNATLANQYAIARDAAGLLTRTDRALIEATGKDRAVWLHNLVTNAIKTLQPGEGNYAFAPNAKGRTIFDLNALILDDRLWIDLDRRWAEMARKHLAKYIITEDVALADITPRFERFAITGPAAVEVVGRMGFGNLAPMAQLQHLPFLWDGHAGRMLRNDFTGQPTADLLIEAAGAPSLLIALLDAGRPSGLARIDPEVAEILRVEAGIPASLSEIDEDVIPPETGQIDRGISYHKGCYLGQEVIERMRSHGVVARKLVGIKLAPGAGITCPAPLKVGDVDSGRLTSLVWSYALDAPMGLGYLKAVHAKPGQPVSIAETSVGEVVPLPAR